MENSRTIRDHISAEAIEWFLQFQNDLGPPPDQQAFSEWLLRSPMHIEEYLAVSSAWGTLNIPREGAYETDALIAAAQQQDEPSSVVRLRDRRLEPKSVPNGKSVHYRPLKIGAGLAAAALIGFGLWFGYQSRFGTPTYETAIGEQRSVSLSDGSVVYLNTNSQVRVRWSTAERHIDLIRGEARFQVAKNRARPFVVATTEATVRAVGTVFNVRADRSKTQVAVIEGRVEVKALLETRTRGSGPTALTGNAATASPTIEPSVQLAAGEHAEVTTDGVEPNAGPPLETVTAWTERRLVFREQSLADVVEEFNRYRTQPLVIDDPQLATLKVSGAFELSDPESLVAYLKSFETVRVDYSRDGAVHLSRGPLPIESSR